MARLARPKPMQQITNDEYAHAVGLISAGKSDCTVAALISATRAHGALRVDPDQIKQIRTDIGRG